MGCFGLLNLPLRAPMLNVLFGVAVVMGHQWSMAQIQFMHSRSISLEPVSYTHLTLPTT